MKKSLLDSFKNIYLDMNNLSSYKSYYDALTLWDMVTIRSDKICLNCGDGDLRYLKINTNKSDNGKVILECNICGKAVNIDGCECKDEIENYYPACKEDIYNSFL